MTWKTTHAPYVADSTEHEKGRKSYDLRITWALNGSNGSLSDPCRYSDGFDGFFFGRGSDGHISP